ncbi:MAG: hypothetical protein CMK59_11985 [Proteobacteria bacterium]|nr:hypothetical protein [Pseudomonadota bacterium]
MEIIVFLTRLVWGEVPKADQILDSSVDMTLMPIAFQEQMERSSEVPLQDRIQQNSQLMLGLPYLFDAIGEEQLPDEDPLFRYDGYDCLTFVEHTLALSLAKDLLEFEDIVVSMRYSQGPSYVSRNHFMLAQWIPNVLQKEYFEDVTRSIGPTRIVQKELVQRNWDRWKGRHRYHLQPEDYPKGQFLLEIVPIDVLIFSIDNLQTGDLLIVVRENNPYNPILITHLGWYIQAEQPLLRHATKMGTGGVRDDSLIWYLNHLHYSDKWPIAGFLVLRPQDDQKKQ